MKNPLLACFLSIVAPGLGQIYLNEKAKGFSILFITLGVVIALTTTQSTFALILLAPIYLFVMIPAATEAYQTAAGKPRTFSGESIAYVIVMLLVVGPFSIPLLWQSPKFSKTMKIVLTVLVTLMAVVAIFAMTLLAASFEEAMKGNSMALSF